MFLVDSHGIGPHTALYMYKRMEAVSSETRNQYWVEVFLTSCHILQINVLNDNNLFGMQQKHCQ